MILELVERVVLRLCAGVVLCTNGAISYIYQRTSEDANDHFSSEDGKTEDGVARDVHWEITGTADFSESGSF